MNSYMAQMAYYRHEFENSESEELVDLYADEGITGTSEDKREEFGRLMKDCRRGKIDRIYTKSISRFARNIKDCLKNIRELKVLGIGIIFEKENINTAEMTDEMVVTVMGDLAQEESVSLSNNMRWSIQKRMANGTFVISHLPYGYEKYDGKMVINPEEAEVGQRIFRAFLNGKGMGKIAEELRRHRTKIVVQMRSQIFRQIG